MTPAEFAPVALLLLVAGCGEAGTFTRMEHECRDPADRKAAAECLVKCNESANPKSDEEGEDLARQCSLECQEILCPTYTMKFARGTGVRVQ